MPDDPKPTSPDRSSCEIRDWPVFAEGVHKGELYSRARCLNIGRNFARLSSGVRPHLVPTGKLGHDKQQRMSQSLGFPNAGRIAALETLPNGTVVIRRMTGIPVPVGRMIAAGRINTGSVELKPRMPDPNDPGKVIDGPILDGVSFLGEEQPAVKGFEIPRPVYPDGTPVEPAGPDDDASWLSAMASVSKHAEMSATDPRDEYAAYSICFSEMQPMDPMADKKAALLAAGLTPEEVEKCIAALGAAAPMAAETPPPPPAMPAPAEPTPAPAAMSGDMPPWAKEFSTFMSDCTKRMGALEAAKTEDQKKAEAGQMAAFSERVNNVLDSRENRKRVPPAIRQGVAQLGLDSLTTKTFADVSGDAEKAFARWKAFVEQMPESKFFSDAIDASKPQGKGVLTPFQSQMVNSDSMKRYAPRARKALLDANAVS